MIKLNNKNITYVALADSNNSIKAPKEVWYADTNNSVKLVYRRKDALIEGEDYEKYHWLKGDRNSYLDVKGFSRNENWEITTSIKDIKPGNYFIGLYGYSTDADFGQKKAWTAYTDDAVSYVSIRRTDGININDSARTNVQSVNTIVDGHNIVVINGTTFTMSGRQYGSDAEFLLYAVYRYNVVPAPSECCFSEFLVKESNVPILDFIPCKLLKPVPKWLDANGIRRQVGECGMIDLVSGKFYGNVNNAGTFTVENYYERKEWLQGRNGAYINTNHKLVTIEDRFDVKARLCSSLTRENDIFGYLTDNQNDRTYSIAIFHNLFGSNLCTSYCNYYGNAGTFRPIQHSISPNTPFTLSLYADSNEYHSVCNGNEIRQTTNGMTTDTYDDVYLFNMNIGNPAKKSEQLSKYFNGDIAYFIISNNNAEVVHLIPCTLTMDLPASMDANNIARTKGTSGMWDLVSDRFYGNVANSGTFKAVNLAEGVDYEVHQWLKGDGEAYIDTLVNKLKGTITVDIDRTAVTSNSNILGREAYPGLGYESRCVVNLLRQNNNYIADIYGVKTSSGYGVRIDSIDTLYLDLDTKTASTKSGNSTSIDIGTDIDGYNMLLFAKNSGSAPSYCWSGSIGSFKMADVINFIPVKLLRSIPSKYDANGIARQAGECGMYDTVNDVFYGNVASSGTFSVSDD